MCIRQSDPCVRFERSLTLQRLSQNFMKVCLCLHFDCSLMDCRKPFLVYQPWPICLAAPDNSLTSTRIRHCLFQACIVPFLQLKSLFLICLWAIGKKLQWRPAWFWIACCSNTCKSSPSLQKLALAGHLLTELSRQLASPETKNQKTASAHSLILHLFFRVIWFCIASS